MTGFRDGLCGGLSLPGQYRRAVATRWKGPHHDSNVHDQLSRIIRIQPPAGRWSREFTVRFLRPARGTSDDVTDTALHIVSELVTNAIHAARKLGHRSTVGLSLRLFGDHLLIEAVDSSPEIPVLDGTADVFFEHGRGLYLVDGLTDGRWSWFRWPGMPRKVVWARLMV